MLARSERKSRIWSVVRVSSGNFLEMYDFMVFGYYASAIARTFFPAGSEFASLMLSLMTFGAGFLMRPLGAIVLGAYTDHHGRRAGLLLTLALMAVGILSIACVPGYKTIGIVAPLLVVCGRLLQGFSAGAELGSVSVYLSEIATPGHKGFYVSWQSGSQQVAVMFAALLGVVLNTRLSTRADGSVGMAIAAADWLPHHPGAVRAARFAAGDRRIPGAQGASQHRRDSALAGRKLARGSALEPC